MAEEKKGFFKRVFSFGRNKDEKPEPVEEIAPPAEEAIIEPEIPTLDNGTEAITPDTSILDQIKEEEAYAENTQSEEQPETLEAPRSQETPEESIVESSDDTQIISQATPPIPELELESKSEPSEVSAPKSWVQRLTGSLARTSASLTGNITALFTKRKLDDDTLQDLEDLLIQADLGVDTAIAITEKLSATRYGKNISGEEIRNVLAEEVEAVLAPVAIPLELDLSDKPHVILVVGVNGTGKTTTIGKLTAKLREDGLKVMLAAGDTFRAAAVEQLKIWGARTGARIISRDIGADAAGLAYDAIKEAKEAGTDVLLIDTAGRLQNKTELMDELEKVIRVIKKQDQTAPHTVLLTLDATTGQNALQQVEIFGKTAGVTGLVMTKLDGTARGGILVAIARQYALPIHFIGIGEGMDDLAHFKAADFAAAIAGKETQ